MAKIFISYSNKDKALVSQYADELRIHHEVLIDSTAVIPGDEQNSLLMALKEADGTVVFLTENSIRSQHVNSEIGIAKSLVDLENKFLIPLVSGNIEVPYIIRGISYLRIDEREFNDVLQDLAKAIQFHLSKKQPDVVTKEIDITPELFAKLLYDFLSRLPLNARVGDWTYNGPTRKAYGTPSGAFSTIGFEFISHNYSFIIRSVWNMGQSKQASYLVIESNNLKSQLARVALNNTDKFWKGEGEIVLYETFDMTIGFGKRARNEVREAFNEAEFPSNVITNFKQDNPNWLKIVEDILRWSTYREAARLIIQKKIDNNKTAEATPAQNYWFLKIYGDNWNIREGDTGHFNSHFNSYEKRPDYASFASVRRGDKGVAYDYSSKSAIVFLFEVTQELHVDESREEIFSFVVTMMLDPGIELSLFAEQIHFTTELDRESLKKLFPLSEAEYEYIFNLVSSETLVEFPGQLFIRPALSKILSDSAAEEIKDELGFENDVNALASVIAYKKMTPPLAIGLFGNWGTGKSFFMGKLRKQIDELRKDKTGTFCKTVLQINFNSWHYSDSNLWASLVTKIFEDLEKEGQGKKDELNELFKSLNSTKELLQKTEDEKAKIDKKIELLTQQQGILDATIQQQSEKLGSLSFDEILKGLLTDTAVKADFDKLQSEYSFLRLKDYDDIEKNVEELHDFSGKAVQSLKLVPTFFKGWNVLLLLLLAMLVAAGVFALVQNSGFFKQYMGDYKAFVLVIAGTIGFYAKFLRPAFKIVNTVFRRLQSLNTTVNTLKEKARSKYADEKQQLDKERTETQGEADKLQKEIELLKAQQENIQSSLDEITSGKRIIKFIESKVTDERYISSLGIISWIRRDLEQLDRLLVQQKDAEKKVKEADKAAKRFKLERIVLYIDDLDRCNESIVIKVLEAINLLLAFPLFVVVVGVDPRWMHKALTTQYSKLLSDSADDSPHGDEGLVVNGRAATSYDYLEKIFQIPFVLKKIDYRGKSRLIRSLIEEDAGGREVDLAEEEIPSDAVPGIPAPAEETQPGTEVPPQNPLVQRQPVFNESNPGEQPSTVEETAASTEEPGISKALPEALNISEEETRFMEEISFLIGESPRTIKRYINMYRIIRTHNNFTFADQNELEHYYAAMVLLGVITGLPEYAKTFFEKIDSVDENVLFDKFLKEDILKDAPNLKPLKTLSAFILDQNKRDTVGVLNAVRMEKFKKNLHLVSRFSFRHIF